MKRHRYIRWIEQRIGITIHDFVDGAISTNTATLIQSGIIFGTSIVFAHLMSPEAYGSYKYVLTTFSLFSLASLPGMRTAVARAITRGHDRTLLDAFWFTLKTSIFASILSVLCGMYYLHQGASLLGTAFLYAAPFLLLFDSTTLYLSYWNGKRRFLAASLFSTTRLALSSLATILGIVAGASVPVLVLILVASESTIRVAFFVLTVRYLDTHSLSEKGVCLYGFHLTFSKGIVNVAGFLESILLFQNVGAASLAIYTFATAPLEQLRSMQTNLATVTFPRFAEDTWQMPPPRALAQKLFRPILIGIVFTIVYIVCIPFFFNTLFSTYTEAIWYSQLLALGILPTTVSALANNIAQAKQMTREIYSRIGYNILTTLILVPILIISFGILGLVIAVIIRKYIMVYIDIAHLYHRHVLPIPTRLLPKPVVPTNT